MQAGAPAAPVPRHKAPRNQLAEAVQPLPIASCGRTAGGLTTDFLSGPGGISLEKQGSTVTATYTIGNALLRKDGEYPLFDGLGSERTVTNSSQTVTGTATYEGFGQTVATTGSSSDPNMFAATSGYRNDGDAGLMHVGARYYDSQAGRFITRDTVLDQHPFLYCNHDPVNRLDPDGHKSFWEKLKDAWETVSEPLTQIKEWYERADYAKELVELLSSWNCALIQADCSRKMRHMINTWPGGGPADPSAWYAAWQQQMRDGIGRVHETAGDTAKWYYKNLYPPEAP